MFNQKHFSHLINFQNSDSPCVSIFIPTYRAGNVQEDRIRLKNAISEAIQQLTDDSIFQENKMEKKQAIKFLAPASILLEDENLWTQLSDGLAIFIGKNHFSYFVTPINFPEMVHVNDHFHLRYMLPMLKDEKKFFVLALSQNEVRFFEGNANSITPVIINDLVPNSTAEMIGADDNSSNLQAQSKGAVGAIFHGHGAGKDDKNIELEKFFRDIDSGLMQMLHDEDAPMVIYSVENQIALYQEISNYSNINNNHITGNPENDDPVLIHEKAWAAVQDYFIAKNKTSTDEFNQNLVNGKASFSIHEIVPSAINGKVDTLFVDSETEIIWGAYDKEKASIQLHEERQPDSICLLNKAALETFQNGGTVHNRPRTEMPRLVTNVNAVFRY